jgi:hemolysin III
LAQAEFGEKPADVLNPSSRRRVQTRGEQIADGYIHVVGIAGALIGIVVLCSNARLEGAREFLSVLAYCGGLIGMLVCSAAYNMVSSPRLKPVLRRFDHAAIFVMIAGTYTPFTVNRLQSGWSAAMTAAVWSIAVVAGTAKLFMPRRLERYSLLLYLALGWIGLIALKPLIAGLDTKMLVLLGAGGARYSLGTIFHVWRGLSYQNAVWHAFVLAAAGCHYAAVLHQVALA